MCRAILPMAVMLLLVTQLNADIINVPDDYSTIQAGIDAAMNGDEIVVAPGTYNELVNFNGKAIAVRSSAGADVTTLDGSGLNSSIVKFMSGEGRSAVLDGFTLTNGTGDPGLIEGATVGGAIRMESSSPTILNCNFIANNPTGGDGRGGGMYLAFSNPLVTDCVFSANNPPAGGGGMWIGEGSPTIARCVFVDNNTGPGGGAGAALSIGGSASAITTITNCTFTNNTVGWSGGAMVINQSANATIINSLFVGNSASNEGGAISIVDSAGALIVNSTFVGNTSAGNNSGGSIHPAGAIRCRNGGATVVTVSNSILWDNSPPQISASFPSIVSYSNIMGGLAETTINGPGNIDIDPSFIDVLPMAFRLSPDSPCIDAGTNSDVIEGTIADLNGEFRFIDDPDTTNSGESECLFVDMGAYEYQGGTSVCCPPDLNGDTVVGAADLAIVLGHWGPCPAPCDQDLHGTGDGFVDAGDLSVVLGAWGPCE